MRVVLLGPPGVGKGTQGRRLATGHGWALISTGEMLREAASRGTDLGIEARRLMDGGRLVSDEVMIGVVKERTSQPDAVSGYVLDGFPRTVTQADALGEMLRGRGQDLDAAVSLAVPDDELVRRMSERRECPVCKRSYNLVSAPPRDGKHCDDHPATELRQRADDAPNTVKRRLEIYARETAPLLDYYGSRGCLREVAGLGTMDEVYGQLSKALGF